MSVVSGVLLIVSSAEDFSLVEAIDPALQRLDMEAAGGNKHPQLQVYAAGFNYWGDDKPRVIQAVLDAPWRWPESVRLIVQPEDGETEIFRPGA